MFVIDGIYFCRTQADAEIVMFLREREGTMFDYGHGWDDPEGEEQRLVEREVNPEDQPMSELQQIPIEDIFRDLEGDEDREGLMQLSSEKTTLDYSFIFGE